MTLDIYAGLFPDDVDEVGSRLDALVPHLDSRLVEGGTNDSETALDLINVWCPRADSNCRHPL
jgi:hypothetical protein